MNYVLKRVVSISSSLTHSRKVKKMAKKSKFYTRKEKVDTENAKRFVCQCNYTGPFDSVL